MNQLEFFNKVELTEEGKLMVDVSQMDVLVNLLSLITIQMGDITENQDEMKSIVEDINSRLTEFTTEINDTTNKIQEVKCRPQCPPAVPQLVGKVFVHPNGAVTNSVPKRTIYNWGGFNIVM